MTPAVTRIEVFKGKEGDWRWRGRAANGRIVVNAEEGHRRRWYVKRKVKRLFPGVEIVVK